MKMLFFNAVCRLPGTLRKNRPARHTRPLCIDLYHVVLTPMEPFIGGGRNEGFSLMLCFAGDSPQT